MYHTGSVLITTRDLHSVITVAVCCTASSGKDCNVNVSPMYLHYMYPSIPQRCTLNSRTPVRKCRSQIALESSEQYNCTTG